MAQPLSAPPALAPSPLASAESDAVPASRKSMGAEWDRSVIAHVVADDALALGKLEAAGFEHADIAARASALGLTSDFVKKSKLSGATAAMRTCVKCDQKFLSSGAHNRLCSRCPAK